jgi:hypothetical protein
MWGKEVEKCLVKNTIQNGAKLLDTRDNMFNTESQATFFFVILCSLQKLIRIYLYVKMIMNGRLQWEFFIMSLSIAAVTETFSHTEAATAGNL